MTPRSKGPHRSLRGVRALLAGVAAGLLVACGGDSPADPDDDPIGDPPPPGPGPWYSVSPVEIDSLVRVTPIGNNGKVMPIGHTYWYTCDNEYVMPVTDRCVRAHLPIRAPGDGVIFSVDHTADGEVTVEGPFGLRAGFSHVTPVSGLARGDSVQAGDTIAVMYTDYAFDFGLTHLGIDPHVFVRAERYENSTSYRYAQNPIAQFPEPLRSRMLALVQTEADPYGRISYDVAGTAQGNWFRPDVSLTDPFLPIYESGALFLGRLQERDATRVLTKGGGGWYPDGFGVAVVDDADPSWDALTPSSGTTQLRLWELARDGRADLGDAYGSVLIEVLPDERIRIEWFDTHDPVAAFTDAAVEYVR